MATRPIRHAPVIFLLAALAVLLAAGEATARWASIGEAPAATLLRNVTVAVDGTGAYEQTVEEEILLNNELGRQRFGTFRIVYNARTSSYEILAAESRSGEGAAVPVRPEYIEDKPMASNLPGFDQLNRITVAFSHVEAGARIYVKYRFRVSEVPFPGHFSALFAAGEGTAMRHLAVEIRSKIPLKVRENDPDDVLDLEAARDGETAIVRVSLKRPAYYQLTDEDRAAFIARDQIPYAAVSTHDDFAAMVRETAAAWRKVLDASLPAAFEAVAEAAGREPGIAARLDAVTSGIAERVRYWADWRPVNGGFVPRPLETIAASRFGDCKDLSALAVAVLRRLGMTADVAWVSRGALPPPPPVMASPDAFNHAVVRVAHENAVYWLDPTNPVSFSRGIFGDIAERYALVLDAGEPRMERVPLPEPAMNRFIGDTRLRIRPTGEGRVSSVLHLAGLQAANLTGSGRFLSEETLRHKILEWFAEGRRVLSGTVSPFDARSPVVRDIDLRIEAELEAVGVRASPGMSYRADVTPFELYKKIDPARHEGNFFLGLPGESRSIERIEEAAPVGRFPEPCSVASPWLDASLAIREEGRDVVIERRITGKRQVLTREEVRGEDFPRFQKAVRECFGDFAVVFAPRAE